MRRKITQDTDWQLCHATTSSEASITRQQTAADSYHSIPTNEYQQSGFYAEVSTVQHTSKYSEDIPSTMSTTSPGFL